MRKDEEIRELLNNSDADLSDTDDDEFQFTEDDTSTDESADEAVRQGNEQNATPDLSPKSSRERPLLWKRTR